MKLISRFLLGLLLLIGVFPAVCEDVWKIDKTTGCRIEAPQSWGKYSVQWIGSCPAGLADGSGVLKSISKQKVQEIYYGRASQGMLKVGVIESDRGFIAGRFSNGIAVTDENRQFYIMAFREAVAGAKQASEYYKKKGSMPSARYYAEKAKLLDQQLD